MKNAIVLGIGIIMLLCLAIGANAQTEQPPQTNLPAACTMGTLSPAPQPGAIVTLYGPSGVATGRIYKYYWAVYAVTSSGTLGAVIDVQAPGGGSADAVGEGDSDRSFTFLAPAETITGYIVALTVRDSVHSVSCVDVVCMGLKPTSQCPPTLCQPSVCELTAKPDSDGASCPTYYFQYQGPQNSVIKVDWYVDGHFYAGQIYTTSIDWSASSLTPTGNPLAGTKETSISIEPRLARYPVSYKVYVNGVFSHECTVSSVLVVPDPVASIGTT